MMAEIFNNFDRQTETRFITALEERNRDAAERIKALMFTFEDLIKLDTAVGADAAAQDRQGQAGARAQGRHRGRAPVLLLQHVDARRQDAAGGHGGHGPGAPARRRRGAGALVKVAKDLAAKGEIMIAKGRGDDEMIY